MTDKPDPKGSPFWDSTFALILLIAAILYGRFLIAEPFKIPSGSMEPTLFGHEDYGDRILTNKLAYAPSGLCIGVAAGALGIIAIGFFASRSYKSLRSTIIGGVLFVGAAVGFGSAYAKTAIAGEPQRFDVVVFQYDTDWAGGSASGKSEKINYIKRLCGLPGDHIMISGGDLWLRDEKASDAEGKDVYKIIRKWQVDPEIQEILWYPVAMAWTGDVYKDAPEAQRPNLALPWSGADKGTPGVERKAKSLVLDGSAKVDLNYLYRVSNVYLKQGRWPFVHKDCPAAHLPEVKSSDGTPFRNSDEKSENVTSYIFHTWEGVQCPNCKQVMFPITIDPAATGPVLTAGNAKFFYGGDKTVGDLRIDLDLDVEKPGVITIEAGNSMHCASWTLGAPTPSETASVHPVTKVATLTPGAHKLSLAYVDATVIASLDGQELERRLIDFEIPGAAVEKISNVAHVSFDGFKGSVTKLDLYRDLNHTSMIKPNDPSLSNEMWLTMAREQRWGIDKHQITSHENIMRGIDDDGRYWAIVPKGEYLMLGDNSPSSSDGRVWGFVPRENLVGRASFIGWPPSRARFIR